MNHPYRLSIPGSGQGKSRAYGVAVARVRLRSITNAAGGIASLDTPHTDVCDETWVQFLVRTRLPFCLLFVNRCCVHLAVHVSQVQQPLNEQLGGMVVTVKSEFLVSLFVSIPLSCFLPVPLQNMAHGNTEYQMSLF